MKRIGLPGSFWLSAATHVEDVHLSLNVVHGFSGSRVFGRVRPVRQQI